MNAFARRFSVRVVALALLALALGGAGCGSPPELMRPDVPIPPARDRLVATAYPTLAEIYGGAQGIYRGCGPNGNVCHNSRQYPNMNTLGALSLTVNQPCNQLQDDPTRIDDWCERQGDTVRLGNERYILAYIQRVSDRTDTQGSRWAVAVQGEFPATLPQDRDLNIVRVREGQDDDYLLGFDSSRLTRDPMRNNVVFVQIDLDDDYRERVLSRAGIPAERDAIQFGDPNRNGVFGLALGNRLVYPGHPERSYLIRRMIDPTAGPLMPLANCCFWSKESLRALWCWIANLRDDGSNAMDPIDYSVCPEGPIENVAYPTPGPTCENGGLCPVHTRDPIPNDPTWANVYQNVLVPRCGGSGCHRSGDMAGNLDLGTSETAYDQLLRSSPARVVPGDPNNSLMYQRVTQMCAMGSLSCRRMPLFQGPLRDEELSVIQRWIQNGARMDGTIQLPDVQAMDAMTDTPTMDVPMDAGGLDVPSDIVIPDTSSPDTSVPDTSTPDAAVPTDVPMDSAATDAATD